MPGSSRVALLLLAVVVVAGAAAATASAASAAKRKLSYRTVQALWEAYPPRETSNEELKKEMGGAVDKPRYKNTCAIRLSYAWNRASANVDHWAKLPSNPPVTKVLGWHDASVVTIKDKHGDNVAIRAREMHDLLHKDLGPPQIVTKDASLITGDRSLAGIIVFTGCNFGENTNGNHIDVYQGGTCRNKCYLDKQFGCKFHFFRVEGLGTAPDGTCSHGGKSGVCKDQMRCIEDSGGLSWPAFVPNQCGSTSTDGANIKCCLAA